MRGCSASACPPAASRQPSPHAQGARHRYAAGETVRTVLGRLWKGPAAFRGERVAIRPLDPSGRFGVFFAAHRIATIDLTQPKSVSHICEHLSTMSPD